MDELRQVLMEEAIGLYLSENTELTFNEYLTQNNLVK